MLGATRSLVKVDALVSVHWQAAASALGMHGSLHVCALSDMGLCGVAAYLGGIGIFVSTPL